MSAFDAIGETGLNEVLARRLTTPGGSSAPAVAPEIFPVMSLEVDRPEWGRLKGELYASRFCFLAAVAAQYGAFQIYLPTNARTIAVLTRVTLNNTNVVNIGRLVGISGGLGGWAGVTTCTRDTGWNGNGTACLLESISNVAQPANFSAMAQLVNAGQSYTDPIIIRPGGAIGIYQNAVNLTTSVNISWYERPAQPGEI